MNTNSTSGLRGLRVLEISGDIAAAYCGKLLAGFGAELFRIPAPGARTDGGLLPGWYHTGKRCLDVPGDDAALRRQIEALAAQADLIIEDLGPGRLEALGLQPAHWQHGDSKSVLLRFSPFGSSGPCRGYAADDITLYAASGLMHSTGRGDREPLNAGFPLAQLSAGVRGYCAALMGLHRRQRDGAGDAIDLSLQESALDNYEVALVEYLHTGKCARRNGDMHNLVPWQTYPCRDGWAAIVGGPVRHWARAAEVFGDPELLSPRLAHMAQRMANREEIAERMRPWLMANDKREIFHTGQARGQAWSYLATLTDMLADPHMAAREFFINTPTPDGRTCRQPAAPFAGADMTWHAPPPEACGAADFTPRTDAELPAPQSDATAPAPLAGIRVIDLTHDWAGPHAARMLADYGAEVIKVEYPQLLDGMRGAYAERFDEHPRFHQLHRNKRSVTLDLNDADHHAACLRLLATADVLLDNSRPSVLAKLGLDWASLVDANPGLIAVSLSAFGASGPYRDYAGYGGTIEAISGLQDLTAYDANGQRYRVREMDVLNGVFGTSAILTALAHRQRTGRGQWIDVSETETCAWLLGEHFAAASLDGDSRPRGNRHAQHAPQGCYRCDGDDRWLTLCVRSTGEFHALADRIGCPEWRTDPALQSAEGRQQHHDRLDQIIARWCETRDAFTAEDELQAVGIAVAAVRNAADLADDPHLAARNWWLALDGKRYPGLPFRFRRGDGVLRRRGPDLGQDNAPILAELGLPDEKWPQLPPDSLGTAYEMQP